MFNWIKVWRVWGKEFDDMPSLKDQFSRILSFVKSCDIHHNDCIFRQFWDQILLHPRVENMAVHMVRKQANR